MRPLLVKAITLLLALSALTLLVLHGCSKPPAQSAQNAAAAPASASEEEADPAFLGATKAAMPMPPKKQQKK
jgi:hypothetical protein